MLYPCVSWAEWAAVLWVAWTVPPSSPCRTLGLARRFLLHGNRVGNVHRPGRRESQMHGSGDRLHAAYRAVPLSPMPENPPEWGKFSALPPLPRAPGTSGPQAWALGLLTAPLANPGAARGKDRHLEGRRVAALALRARGPPPPRPVARVRGSRSLGDLAVCPSLWPSDSPTALRRLHFSRPREGRGSRLGSVRSEHVASSGVSFGLSPWLG